MNSLNGNYATFDLGIYDNSLNDPLLNIISGMDFSFDIDNVRHFNQNKNETYLDFINYDETRPFIRSDSPFTITSDMDCTMERSISPFTNQSDMDSMLVKPVISMKPDMDKLKSSYLLNDLRGTQFDRSHLAKMRTTTEKINFIVKLEKYVPKDRSKLTANSRNFISLCMPILHCFRKHHNSDIRKFELTYSNGFCYTTFRNVHCNVLRRGYVSGNCLSIGKLSAAKSKEIS
jgi:hypothetical protein